MAQARPIAVGAAGLAAAVAIAVPVTERWEGLRQDPYWDVAHIRTYCFGETHNVEERHYGREECHAKLQASLMQHGALVLSCLPPKAPLSVKASFIVFGYNVGAAAACTSTAASKARAGNYAGACAGLSAWNKARVGGKLVVVPGLVARRADERHLCELDLQGGT